MSVCFLVLSTLTYELIGKTKSTEPPALVTTIIDNELVSKILLLHFTARDLKDIDTEVSMILKPTANSALKPTKWQLFAVFMDRIYFLVFLTVFTIYHA